MGGAASCGGRRSPWTWLLGGDGAGIQSRNVLGKSVEEIYDIPGGEDMMYTSPFFFKKLYYALCVHRKQRVAKCTSDLPQGVDFRLFN